MSTGSGGVEPETLACRTCLAGPEVPLNPVGLDGEQRSVQGHLGGIALERQFVALTCCACRSCTASGRCGGGCDGPLGGAQFPLIVSPVGHLQEDVPRDVPAYGAGRSSRSRFGTPRGSAQCLATASRIRTLRIAGARSASTATQAEGRGVPIE